MASVQAQTTQYAELQLVEYPGLVKNTNKMIETLGGIKKISQVLCSQQKQLELRYHYKNSFNKATYSDCVSRGGLLLSIKVRRHKHNKSLPPQYDVQIMGYCQRNFVFERLNDFQYLPLVNPALHDTAVALFPKEKLLLENVHTTEFFDVTDMPPICVPELFARSSETVHARVLRSEIGPNEHGQHNVLGVMLKSAADNRSVINFSMTDGVPEEADAQILKRMKVKYITDDQLETVKRLLDDCPIWTRIALLHETKISKEKMKYILPALTYSYTTGPWRSTHVRYGYDPRKDINSRIYQTFDFRLRFSLGMSQMITARGTTLKNRLENADSNNDVVLDLDYPYLEENKLPRSRQCLFRYCDIHLRKVREKLGSLPSTTNSICDEKLGWLPAGFENDVRSIITNSMQDLLRQYYRNKEAAVSSTMQPNAHDSELQNDVDSDEEPNEEDSDQALEENLLNLLEDVN